MELMADDASPGELLFEVLTPLGFRVRVTRAYWNLIVTIKHPVMAGREEQVKDTLQNPSEIRQSKSDPVCICSIKWNELGAGYVPFSKRLDGEGFLITAYPTDAIKEGELIWPK